MGFDPRVGGYVRMIHQEWIGVIECVDYSEHATNIRLKIRPVFLPLRAASDSTSDAGRTRGSASSSMSFILATNTQRRRTASHL